MIPRTTQKFWRGGVYGLAFLVFLQPVLGAFSAFPIFASTPILAADTPTKAYYGSDDCYNAFANPPVADAGNGATLNTGATADENGMVPLTSLTTSSTDPSLAVDYTVNVSALAAATGYPTDNITRITNPDYIKSVVDDLGNNVFSITITTPTGALSAAGTWVVSCDTPDSDDYGSLADQVALAFNPVLAVSPGVTNLVSIIGGSAPRIAFANPMDKYALLGETCAGGLITTPQDQWTDNTNPCPGFNASADDVFRNGKWDAPKVDERVLDTLAYLVTPVRQGGAGREYLRIKKLTQTDNVNNLDIQPVVDTSTTSTTTTSDTATQIDQTIANQLQPENGGASDQQNNSDGTTAPSSYKIDPADPPHLPKLLSRSVMIDQIDKFRMTTQVISHRLLGNDSTEYKVQTPVPIDVAWQSNAGQQKDAPPDISKMSLLSSSRYLVNASIIQMLNQYGLGDLEIDTTKTNINSFGDVATLVGQSLLEQLLGSPRGSIAGWNLVSTLKSIGLAYVEQNLGLVPGALADANPLDKIDQTADFSHLASSVGRSTIEYVLGFPSGSLRTSTGSSADILENVGRTYLEKNLLQVSDGTLLADTKFPLNNVGDLLERLGEGRIEAVFKLPKQSLRKTEYQPTAAANSFRESSFKATLLFPKLGDASKLTETDYQMAAHISAQLSLAFVPYSGTDAASHPITSGNTNMYGFTADDFNLPSLKIDPTDGGDSLRKFKQLVGSRAIETSLGLFKREGSADTGLNPQDNNLAPVTLPKKADGSATWPVTINGQQLNYQYRPATEPNRPSVGSWCSAAGRSYVTGKGDGGGGAGFTISGDLTPTQVSSTIDQLKEKVGSLSGRWGVFQIPDCSPDPTITKDRVLTGLLNSTLFDPTPQTRVTFLNQDKAPQRAEFNISSDHGCDGDASPGGGCEDNVDYRVNTATLLYYNLPDNHKEVPVNTVSTKDSAVATIQSSNNDVAPPPDTTVAAILQQLATGGVVDTSFSWEADASLQKRLQMMQQLLQKNTADNYFDTAALLAKNLAGEQLDGELVDRLNTLTVRPVSDPQSSNIGKFADQYNDPQYNGWLFLLQDLRSRLDCKLTNGFYGLNSNETGYICVPRSGAPELSNLAKQEISQTKTLLDGLYAQPWAMAQSLLASIQTHTFNDPSGFTGQSAMSAVAALSSAGRDVDENFRFKKSIECSTPGSKCLYSRDIIRALVAPTGAGVVPLSSSIADFFVRKDGQRSLLGEAGRNYASQKFASNTLDQQTFVAKLKTDFSAALKVSDKVSKLFDTATTAANQYGLDKQSLTQKGLQNEDFIRIFQLDLSDQVFERVGKDQLLRVIWQKSGAATMIKSSETYQAILRQANQVLQSIDFYQQRLAKIRTLSQTLKTQLAAAGSDFSLLGSQLDDLVTPTVDVSSTRSIEQLKSSARAYEPTVQAVQKTLKSTITDADAILKNVSEILHLAQEMAAGKPLPRDEQYSIGGSSLNATLKTGSDTRSTDPCFNKSQLLNLVTGGGNVGQKIAEFGVGVGGCRLESFTGLPSGTVSLWYNLGAQQFPPVVREYTYADFSLKPQFPAPSTEDDLNFEESPDQTSDPAFVEPGSSADILPPEEIVTIPTGYVDKIAEPAATKLFTKQSDGSLKAKVPVWNANQWNVSNFRLAVALADKNKNSGKLDSTQMLTYLANQDAPTILGLLKTGDTVLQQTLIAKLLQLIPGIGAYAKKYGLTTRDFVAIMQGDYGPITSKIGGSFLDKALNLPHGTGAQLIFPTCRNNDGATKDSKGKPIPCNSDPTMPGTNPNNVRAQILASLGLKALGLETPDFPTYFNITGSGNLLENWGNAVVSKDLNLKANSFKGKITDSPQCGLLDAEATKRALRCKNSSRQLALAFGLNDNYYIQNFEKIVQALQQTANQDLDSPGFIGDTSSQVQKFYETALIQVVTNPDSISRKTGYWETSTDPTILGAEGLLMSDADFSRYKDAIAQLWQSVLSAYSTNAPLANKLLSTLLKTIPASLGATQQALQPYITNPYLYREATLPITLVNGSALQGDRYAQDILYFQYRLSYLNRKYGFGNADQLFQKFMQGAIPAETISSKIGITQTAGNILGGKIDAWLDKDAPGWLKDLNQATKYITAEQCTASTGSFASRTQGIGIGTLLVSTVSGNNSCLDSVGKITGQQLIYSTDASMVKLRELIFDRTLGHIFSNKFETQLGFANGTFKKMIDDPANARQVLVTQGVTSVANRVFGTNNQNDPCLAKKIPDASCERATIMNAVHGAFLAGFCDDIKKNQCSLSFNQKRSTQKFMDLTNLAIDSQLKRVSKQYLGIELSREDFKLQHGDMHVFALIGVQVVVNQLNAALFKGSNSSPLAKYYASHYELLRQAVDFPSAKTLQALQGSARASYVQSVLCGDQTGFFDGINCQIKIASMGGFDLAYTSYVKQLEEGTLSVADKDSQFTDTDPVTGKKTYHIKDSAVGNYIGIGRNDGEGLVITEDELRAQSDAQEKIDSRAEIESRAQQIRHDEQIEAQKTIQYATLDIIAFSKDKNVPPNFSRRLFGTSAERSQALSEYLFNGALNSKSDLGKFLRTSCAGQKTTAECLNLFQDFASALKSPQQMQDFYRTTGGATFLTLVDKGLDGWFKQVFGFTLPAGTLKGLYVWEMHGAKGSDFWGNGWCESGTTASGGCTGPLALPMGKVLENWGEQQLASMGDKMLGLKTGTSAKIIQLAKLVTYNGQFVNFSIRATYTVADADKYIQIYNQQGEGAAKLYLDKLESDKLQAAKAKAGQVGALVSSIVVSLFSKELAELDKSLGLPAGTTTTLVGAAVTYAATFLIAGGGTAAASAATAAAFGPAFFIGLGIQLVTGVTRVSVTTLATGDGYYPFYSTYNNLEKGPAARCVGSSSGILGGCKADQPYGESVMKEGPLGTFDPTKATVYRSTLKKIAQAKVKALITDVIQMPASQWAIDHGYSGPDLWASQIFTYGGVGAEFDPTLDPTLSALIHRPPPLEGEANPSFGYGTLEEQCQTQTSIADDGSNSGELLCTPNPGWLIGVRGLPTLLDAVHIRWGLPVQ